MDLLNVVAFISSIASLILAVVAIFISRANEKDSRDNFDKTQKILTESYEKTKDLLAEIDKRAAITEKVVNESSEKMLTTLTTIINETVLPKKQDMGEQFGLMFMQLLMQNPDSADKLFGSIKPLIEYGNQINKEKNK